MTGDGSWRSRGNFLLGVVPHRAVDFPVPILIWKTLNGCNKLLLKGGGHGSHKAILCYPVEELGRRIEMKMIKIHHMHVGNLLIISTNTFKKNVLRYTVNLLISLNFNS